MKGTLSRPAHGISLNVGFREYILDPEFEGTADEKAQVFSSAVSALSWLKAVGVERDEYMSFWFHYEEGGEIDLEEAVGREEGRK